MAISKMAEKALVNKRLCTNTNSSKISALYLYRTSDQFYSSLSSMTMP